MKYAVRITVIRSECRCGLHSEGQEFTVEDTCPPICHELWSNIYPMLYAIGNGAELESGSGYSESFTADCPDGGRVRVRCETVK